MKLHVNIKRLFVILAFLFLSGEAFSRVRLPKLVSNGMILQRNAEVNIWGWASPGEMVTVRFLGKSYSTTTANNHKWSVTLSNMEAGGPYYMQINGDNEITLKNIMVGDVWVCSGQSNMVLQMYRVAPIYQDVIAHSENPNIRQFLVGDHYNFKHPESMVQSGSWVEANPYTISNFSATAYFFAKALYERYHIPIGIINASVGGTPITAWMSEDALKNFPKYLREAKRCKNEKYLDSIQQRNAKHRAAWYGSIRQDDQGLNGKIPWYNPTYNASQWKTIQMPGFVEDQGLQNFDGIVWLKKTFDVPAFMCGKQAKLLMGRIVNADHVYMNGIFVGNTTYQYPPRRYKIAPGILKPGKNTITVRLMNHNGKAGFIKDKPYRIIVGNQAVDLRGTWKYKVGVKKVEPLKSITFIRNKPEGLFNGMIAPMTNYTIKGFAWYQGASNTGNPEGYLQLFAAMIKDWRKKWNHGGFACAEKMPFLFVQINNYGKVSKDPSANSGWAKIREAQLQTLALPNTGMAVTIGTGEWNDVHPLNKQAAGNRLARAAEKITYGKQSILYSGPVFHSMEIRGDSIILKFNHVGGGLTVKGNEGLKGFAIAGKDKKFVWAQAKIMGKDKVAVWSDEIAHPAFVRYAWADNPVDANLFNRPINKNKDISLTGLPASPFRTNAPTICELSKKSTLKAYAPVPIGVAIGFRPMKSNKNYKQIVTRQFDQVTFENALKNASVVESDGTFNYHFADELAKICKRNNLKIFGHALCWYQQNSSYLHKLKDDSAAIEHFLEKYITTTLHHYKNDIYAWDVVNEAVNKKGNLRVDGADKPGYFYWGKYLGKNYIERAFRYAHAADKDALLFYNDYDLEKYTAKLEGVVQLLNRLKKKEVPIDGVGTQMHVSIYTDNDKIDRTFRKLAATGLFVRISELDIKVNPKNNPDFVLTDELKRKQAEKAKYVLKSYFENVPAQQRFGITFWNVGAKDSWITKINNGAGSPTLYDKYYIPKAMYYSVLEFFENIK